MSPDDTKPRYEGLAWDRDDPDRSVTPMPRLLMLILKREAGLTRGVHENHVDCSRAKR
ncbi:Uncharacterized protein DAT39_022882, partial [Clarias magur]